MPEEKLLKDENINICPIKEQILLYYGILTLFLLLLYFFYLSYEEPFLGWFDTELSLNTAHPAADDGNYAFVYDTDTMWVWETDAWVDSY